MPGCEEEQSASWGYSEQEWQHKRRRQREGKGRRHQTKPYSPLLSLSKPGRCDHVEARRSDESQREHPAERIQSIRADERSTQESPSEWGHGKLAIADQIRERAHRADPKAESRQGVQS